VIPTSVTDVLARRIFWEVEDTVEFTEILAIMTGFFVWEGIQTVHAIGAFGTVTAVVEAVDGILVDAVSLVLRNFVDSLRAVQEPRAALALLTARAVCTFFAVRARNAAFTLVQTFHCLDGHAVLFKGGNEILAVRKFVASCAFSALSQARESLRFYTLRFVCHSL